MAPPSMVWNSLVAWKLSVLMSPQFITDWPRCCTLKAWAPS